MNSHAVQLVRNRCLEHLDEIGSLFKDGAKITLIVRRPSDPEQDFMLTNDTIEGAMEALERSKVRAPL
jgi:hypothetical protein